MSTDKVREPLKPLIRRREPVILPPCPPFTLNPYYTVDKSAAENKPNFSSLVVPDDFDFSFKGFQGILIYTQKPFNYQVSSE